jgi:hypothetical protein
MTIITVFLTVIVLIFILAIVLYWSLIRKYNQDQDKWTRENLPKTYKGRHKGIPSGSVPHPTQLKHPNPTHDHIQHDPDDTNGVETHPDHPNHDDNQGQTEPRISSGHGSIKFGMKYTGEQLRVVDGVAGLGACIDVCQNNTGNICTAASINMATAKCSLFKSGKLVKSSGNAAWVSQPVV